MQGTGCARCQMIQLLVQCNQSDQMWDGFIDPTIEFRHRSQMITLLLLSAKITRVIYFGFCNYNRFSRQFFKYICWGAVALCNAHSVIVCKRQQPLRLMSLKLRASIVLLTDLTAALVIWTDYYLETMAALKQLCNKRIKFEQLYARTGWLFTVRCVENSKSYHWRALRFKSSSDLEHFEFGNESLREDLHQIHLMQYQRLSNSEENTCHAEKERKTEWKKSMA